MMAKEKEVLTSDIKSQVDSLNQKLDMFLDNFKNNYEFSLKRIESGQQFLKEKLDYTPMAIPVGNKLPETYNDAINRILYTSGVIDKDAYDRIRGIDYDGDFNDESDYDGFDTFDDFDDHWKQSSFAKYEDSLDDKPVAKAEGLSDSVESSNEPVVESEVVKDTATSEKETSSN